MISSEIHVINAKIRALKSEMYENRRLMELLQSKNEEEVAVHVFPDIIISAVNLNVIKEFEIKLHTSAIKTFKSLIKYADDYKPFMINLIRKFEISNLKKIVKAIIYPRYKQDIRFLDISPYSSFNPKQAVKSQNLKQLADLLVDTRYSGIIRTDIKLKKDTAFYISNKLDLLDYCEIFDISSAYHGKTKNALIEMICKEARLKNLLWILRLKYYYDVKIDKVSEYVISHELCPFNEKEYEDLFDAKYEDEILIAIPKKLRISLEDMYSKTYKKQLEYEKASFTEVEMCIQKLIKENHYHYLYTRYLTLAPIIAFFGLKLIEITNLNSIVEGFRFNMNREDIKKLLI